LTVASAIASTSSKHLAQGCTVGRSSLRLTQRFLQLIREYGLLRKVASYIFTQDVIESINPGTNFSKK